MIDNQNLSNDKENTTDYYSTIHSIDYPLYLYNIKYNLYQNLINYQIDIINRYIENGYYDYELSGLFSITIASQNLHSHHCQLLTYTLINYYTFSFTIKHMIILNNRQLVLQDKLSINMALNLVNKINKFMDQIQLIVDPVSGKIYFQTKSFINYSSLSHLKKNIIRQDCFYTYIITYSLKKAYHYMDLVLFLIGQITLSYLLTNPIIRSEFPFLSESYYHLKKIYYSIACFGLFGRGNSTFSCYSQYKYNQFDNDNYFSRNLYTSSENGSISYEKEIQRYSNFKAHLYNSLQFYTPNIYSILKPYFGYSVYSNIDVRRCFEIFYKVRCKRGLYNYKIEDYLSKRSENGRRILTIIDVIGLEGGNEEYEGEWRLLSEGGFGVVEIAMVRFKNLSNPYHNSLSPSIRQQLVRKRDKQVKKSKIKRYRKILYKLYHYSHPNITNFYVSFQFGYYNVLFSDYTPHMSLDLYLKKNYISVSLPQKMLFIVQAIEGLMFLHSNKIIHLDIKPGNMLIHKSLRAQLSDFGEAFVIGYDDMETHQHAYTVPYCAPEIFYDHPMLTEKADIYAIGVCLLRQVLDDNYLEIFFKKKFTYRLAKRDLDKYFICEYFYNSFLSPIFKIVQYISILAVSYQRYYRPVLKWIKEVLCMCREFIVNLVS